MERNKHTSFCIICGESFSDIVKPSKEHIIPKALGNKKLVTYCVCGKCNNDLGSNVDSYLTDYILVKIIRKAALEKDKDLKIFDSVMTNDRGEKFRITDQGPEKFPNVSIDKKQCVRMEVSSLEEGETIARDILKKKFNKSNEEIEEILSDPSQFIKSETQYAKAGSFTKEIPLDLTRFRLAAIKIAYEYAVEKLGEAYMTDEKAFILRAYLKAGRKGKREFSEKECKTISEHCHCGDAFTGIAEMLSAQYQNLTAGRKIKYMVSIFQDAGGNLICGIRILDEDFLTFTVLLSKDACKYLNDGHGYMASVLDDDSLIEV